MEPKAESRIGDAYVKIGSRLNVLRYAAESRKPSQCIKIGDACIKIWSRLNVLRQAMHVLRHGAESRIKVLR